MRRDTASSELEHCTPHAGRQVQLPTGSTRPSRELPAGVGRVLTVILCVSSFCQRRTPADLRRCTPARRTRSRGSRLDVEVLRRPRWRWRPAHGSAASTHDRASSRVPTGLGQTHRRCLRPDGRRCTRCRASGDDRRALAPRAEPAPPEGEPGPQRGEPAPTRRGSSSAPGSWLRFWLPFCRSSSSVCMHVLCRICSRRA